MTTVNQVIQVPLLRACALCLHSAGEHLALTCAEPTVQAIHGDGVLVKVARAPGAACGPDAHRLDMLSWKPQRRSV